MKINEKEEYIDSIGRLAHHLREPHEVKTVIITCIQEACLDDEILNVDKLKRKLQPYFSPEMRRLGLNALDEIEEQTAELWILKGGIPAYIGAMVMRHVHDRLVNQNDNADLVSILSVLPSGRNSGSKKDLGWETHLCLETLRKAHSSSACDL
ncbi:hypothetical protein L484_002699 [Morus notabilis]|uniref:Uncharacterized protein n=1 Tax=Morus notabilis TaxID=981085 RepID=W9RK84_9ROSA|nr:hypothetical protein L484_002699 [Morus notabilis]